MIGPPLRKLSTKKFLSIALSGIAAADGLALAAGETLAVVVAGDIAAVAGVMPAAGESPGAAGLVIVAGATAGFEAGGGTAGATGPPGGLTGDVPGGGGWPKEVNTSVTEQRLAISSVFIGLIGKFFPGSNSDRDFPVRLSSMR
ncbi:MAG TPA: hypothetical protein VF345_04645 [Chthoniobacterales bacterium]